MLAVLTPAAAQGAWTGAGGGAPARTAPDRIEIRLASRAAGNARRLPAMDAASGRRLRHARLGIPALDAIAARFPGLTFEREFRGEKPPPAGSGETDFTAFYRVRLPAGLSTDRALATFRALPEVESADPIAILQASAVPNDSLWSVSTWFYQPSRFDVHAPEAWDVTIGDTAVVVAILDTGVLPYHPDLETQIWSNAAEAGGAPNVDDDGNGYVDDANGWDFVDLVAGDQVAPGEDWDEEDADPSDFAGHGTKVAGIVGAATNNGIGVAGTAWRVRLMPLRVMWSETCCPNGVVDMTYVAEALLYAARMGAQVANCSFETNTQPSMLAAANAAIRAGVTIVCPAGNGGTPFHALADREDVLAIGATTSGDVVAAFSNVGPYVDLVAPGVGVHSTYVFHDGPDSVSQRQPTYNFALNGTSFSAPFAAGAAALVQSHRRSLGLPPLPPIDMVFRLRETTDDITAQNPGGADYGTGRLNLHRALVTPQSAISSFFRTGSRHVGPAVVVPATSGASRIAFATQSARLVMVDLPAADTVANMPMGARLARQLAAADLGAGQGAAIFGSTIDGRVTGHRIDGSVLSGWPVTAATGIALTGGPALGDIDGDGDVEVVCGSDDGQLFAWNADGTPVANFPISPFVTASGFSGAVALADVDGQPGVEIVALSRSSELTVIRADGSVLAGWPQTTVGSTTTISPVVTCFGGAEAAILVPITNGIRAYRPSGAIRFSQALAANLAQDPAVADLSGDNRDEVIVTLLNSTATVLDSTGTVRPGWPVALGGASQGPPVVGRLLYGGAPGVLTYRSGALMAWDAGGQRLQGYPRPGAAGSHPTVAELDLDGRSEVVAETGPDSMFYLYDAGYDTWLPTTFVLWPTPRGNMARTGAHAGPPLPELDDVAPGLISDFTAESLDVDRVYLMWTSPGDDGATGRASRYEIHVTTVASEAGTFAGGSIVVPQSPPDVSGSWQVYTLTGLTSGVTYYLAIRAVDEAGNSGSPSNVVVVTPGGGGPPDAPVAGALRPRTQPARVPVELLWQGARGTAGSPHVIRIFDLGGRLVRSIDVGPGAGGTVSWDGRTDGSSAARPGLYFGRLESGAAHVETRIVLIL